MPLAAMTPEIKHCCQKLYPQPTSYQSQHPYTRHHSTSPQVPLQQDVLEATLRRLKKGTAAGPFADLPDTAKAFALYHPPHSTFMPYLQRFGQVLSLILNNTIPPAIKPLLAASHFMALHKDPDDPTKLRPISMGSALRRISGKYIMTLHSETFARILLPQGQFGIAIKGGLQFIVDSIRTLIHRYISTLNPTRILLLLDIINMFNSISRKAARDELIKYPELHCLIPFVDLLYDQPNICYFWDAHGNLDSFLQAEGVAQGCPLGPVLAALVASILLRQLQPTLNQQVTARLQAGDQGDDGQGTVPHTSQYIDDTSLVMAPTDIIPFLAKFQQLGAPLGIQLNYSKTKILTTTTGIPISQAPPSPRRTALLAALAFI